jgi:hypothetical protein
VGGDGPRGEGLLVQLRALVVIAVLLVLAGLVVGAGIYKVAGTDRALTVCGADPPDRPPALIAADQIGVTWSFDPPGFVCVFTDRSGTVVGRLHLGLWP